MLGFLLLLVPVAFGFDKYEMMTVPFKVDNQTGGTAIEQVFMEYQCHSVLHDKNVALNVTIVSSDFVSFAVDQCGKRLFETTTDINNTTYIWDKEWFGVLQTGIHKTCTVITEYALDFIIDCKGPCSGKIYFTMIPFEGLPFAEIEKISNTMEGVIPFSTVGGVPTVLPYNFGLVIEAAFENPRLRIEFAVQYSTSYRLAITKCGLEFLVLSGNGSPTKHTLNWDETKLLRLVKSMQCEGFIDDTITYIMASDKSGSGTVTFLTTRHHPKDLPHHPFSEFGDMILARGVPKHNTPIRKVNAAAELVLASIPAAMMAALLF